MQNDVFQIVNLSVVTMTTMTFLRQVMQFLMLKTDLSLHYTISQTSNDPISKPGLSLIVKSVQKRFYEHFQKFHCLYGIFQSSKFNIFQTSHKIFLLLNLQLTLLLLIQFNNPFLTLLMTLPTMISLKWLCNKFLVNFELQDKKPENFEEFEVKLSQEEKMHFEVFFIQAMIVKKAFIAITPVGFLTLVIISLILQTDIALINVDKIILNIFISFVMDYLCMRPLLCLIIASIQSKLYDVDKGKYKEDQEKFFDQILVKNKEFKLRLSQIEDKFDQQQDLQIIIIQEQEIDIKQEQQIANVKNLEKKEIDQQQQPIEIETNNFVKEIIIPTTCNCDQFENHQKLNQYEVLMQIDKSETQFCDDIQEQINQFEKQNSIHKQSQKKNYQEETENFSNKKQKFHNSQRKFIQNKENLNLKPLDFQENNMLQTTDSFASEIISINQNLEHISIGQFNRTKINQNKLGKNNI